MFCIVNDLANHVPSPVLLLIFFGGNKRKKKPFLLLENPPSFVRKQRLWKSLENADNLRSKPLDTYLLRVYYYFTSGTCVAHLLKKVLKTRFLFNEKCHFTKNNVVREKNRNKQGNGHEY